MQLSNINISLYSNAIDTEGKIENINTVLSLIHSPAMATITNTYRTMQPGTNKSFYKRRSFPAVTFSGTFSQRCINGLVQHSGFICIDLDDLTQSQHDGLKKLLAKDNFIYLLFTSPSGRGLKLIFKIEADPQMHLAYFNAIASYLKAEYNVMADPTGKDVSRLCFLCCDENAYYNPDAKSFPATECKPVECTVANFTNPRKPNPRKAATEDFEWIDIEPEVHNS